MRKINWFIVLLFSAVILVNQACSLQEDRQVAVKTTSLTQSAASTPGIQSTDFSSQGSFDAGDKIDCADPTTELVTDFNIYQTSVMDEPSPRIPFSDPVFSTCLVRLTDRFTDLSEDDVSKGLKNEYARVQSFNADGSWILIRSIEGYWYVYDAKTLEPVGSIPISVEPRWDAQDPDLLYYLEETGLYSYRLSTSDTKPVHDFTLDFPGQDIAAVWTRYEGSPSFDGRYWGFMAEDQEWLATALLVYDLQTAQVISRRELPFRSEIDSVTISPLGNYFLAYFDEACEMGQLGDDSHSCGLMVYDRSLETGRGLLRIIGHSDLAIDENQKEVLIFQDIDQDNISLLDLETGKVTPLMPIDFSHSAIGLHFSGRASRLPGWVLVSTYNGAQPAATWMDNQVFAMELKPGGRVVRLGHTHSIVDENQEHDYWAEPHASVNQDFTRILFTSNWGRSGSGEVETYLIELPLDWMSLLP